MSKRSSPTKKNNALTEQMTKVIFAQFENKASQQHIIDTINGNEEFIDVKKTNGLFKDNLLTAALNNKMDKVALRLIEFGGKSNIGHINSEENTPLLIAVSDVDMIDVVKALVKSEDCNINHRTTDGVSAMTRILEVGNILAFEELLHVPNLELKNYTYKQGLGYQIQLTLLEYILVSYLGGDDNLQHARLLLEEKGLDCYPLHIIYNDISAVNSTALTFAISDYASNVEDALYVIGKLLKFAEKEGDKKYVDCESHEGNAALDLLFEYALQSDSNVDARILKLFIDYYYNNDMNSHVFLRNINNICSDEKLFKELKKLYPKSKKHLLDDACSDVVETHVELVNPVLKTPSPGIQTARRTSSKRKAITKADEIPIVNAIERENPLPLWAQVGDTRERGIRQTKRWRVGGKKTRKHK
jgi:ankyrin repeat protein